MTDLVQPEDTLYGESIKPRSHSTSEPDAEQSSTTMN